MTLLVVPVPADDDRRLRPWHDVESASLRHDRPHAAQRTYGALSFSLRNPSPRRHLELWAATDDDRVLGIAEVSWPLADNLHLCEAEIHVLPALRGRGIGRTLLERVESARRAARRTTVLGEVHTPFEQESAGLRFARAAGFVSVHREDHLVLDLPAAPPSTAEPADGVGIVVWRDRCPEEHLDGFAVMRTRMDQDVPTGDVDLRPRASDAATVRQSEDRLRSAYDTVVAVAVTPGGGYAGYSTVYLPRGATFAQQDDTLVMPEHRGHGLGRRLKLATLAVVQHEHPERTRLHTYTDPDNHAMIRTNAWFGYRTVEAMHEMQRAD